MGVINEHGVILGGEEIVIASDEKCFVAMTVDQHPETGLWAYGVRIDIGGVAVDSFGFSFSPSEKKALHSTRQKALNAGAKEIKRRLIRHQGVRRLNPVVQTAIKEALVQLSALRQLSMFEPRRCEYEKK